MINPNQPAFPVVTVIDGDWVKSTPTESMGLSVRTYLAAQFMQPMLAYGLSETIPGIFEAAAKDAIAAADELIRQLNEPAK